MTTAPPPKKSDLGVRTASAVVMIAVAGSALWLGGYWWTAFVAAVALGVLWEWWGLVRGLAKSPLARLVWSVAGVIYIGLAAATLIFLRFLPFGLALLIVLVGAIIATDVGAYFAGRTIGGPKIAPSISPSKTWAGLGGAILAVALCLVMSALLWTRLQEPDYMQDTYYLVASPGVWLILPVLIALIAQSGDFFESWMKRRAGVKDSGNLIPGHGGLFDRVDGLLAVVFCVALVFLAPLAMSTQNHKQSRPKFEMIDQ
ncbi:phosphatidate cytidylyltransferase [Novosphingobium sp.]|uniref:phosphatidate cytidylyltransferase n=1 Tax=Novosphingobium sp. TaxID=1874826 RepID=UPI0025E65F18|nr:phosphatidate cytidylyltransferase [Novosphingobium sp.]